ncbi:hypothetical protein [Thermoflexibacter ruber]|uniref:Outer membrane protein beta-barrel domain-containing protein n=1 Tax=Thermoflexibacter ruber TaxID=1003 RepID=A0A1I2JNC5_9BACT|nr:hypothetical protein [Thermoflexibacter ruber]SFF56445.1 hypothetical protein SAMN04488541_10597 [Thermoflexibacter ruber]
MKRFLKFLITLIALATFFKSLYGQEKSTFNIKISGGSAYSFFLTRYQENPFSLPDIVDIYKKSHIGYTYAISLSKVWKDDNRLSIGYGFQEFRRVVNLQTLSAYIENYRIFHRDNIWDISYARNFLKGNKHFWFGSGLYYLRPIQQEIQANNRVIMLVTRDNKRHRLHEIGIKIEMDYEFKLRENIYSGLRLQYAHGLSDGQAHFVSLTSYFNLAF